MNAAAFDDPRRRVWPGNVTMPYRRPLVLSPSRRFPQSRRERLDARMTGAYESGCDSKSETIGIATDLTLSSLTGLTRMVLLLLKLAFGTALAGFASLAIVNWIRPDLFRFEVVGETTHPEIIQIVDARLALLDQLAPAQLVALPEEQIEHDQVDGRPAILRITRTPIADDDVQVVVTLAVRDVPGLLVRRVFVAARGFRTGATPTRTPLPERELTDLAMDTDTSLLYSR